MSETQTFDYESEIETLADGLVGDLPEDSMDRTKLEIIDRVETTADSAEIVFKTGLAKQVLAQADTDPDNWHSASEAESYRKAIPQLAYSVVRQDLHHAVMERLDD